MVAEPPKSFVHHDMQLLTKAGVSFFSGYTRLSFSVEGIVLR
jgi:hypothetical protein